MNKSAILGTQAYAKHVASRPWLDMLALGTAGAGLGYAGSQLFIDKATRALLVGKSPEEQAKILADMRENGDRSKTIRDISLLAGGAGILYGAQKHLDFGGTGKDLLNSVISSKHWNSPHVKTRLKARADRNKHTAARTNVGRGNGYTDSRMQKINSYSDPLFNDERIPVSASIDLINEDPFLSMRQRDKTNMVLEGAENSKSGLVSGRSVMQSALRVGVGAVSGFTLGKVMGAMLSLPPPVKRRLSTSGALAGAIVNSGLFSE